MRFPLFCAFCMFFALSCSKHVFYIFVLFLRFGSVFFIETVLCSTFAHCTFSRSSAHQKIVSAKNPHKSTKEKKSLDFGPSSLEKIGTQRTRWQGKFWTGAKNIFLLDTFEKKAEISKGTRLATARNRETLSNRSGKHFLCLHAPENQLQTEKFRSLRRISVKKFFGTNRWQTATEKALHWTVRKRFPALFFLISRGVRSCWRNP